MKQGVIFDMDGVLFDTEKLYQKGWDSLARDAGYEVNPSFAKAMCGASGENVPKIVEAYYPGMDGEKTWQACRARVEEWLMEGIPVMPGAEALLKELKKAGFRIAIASSNQTERILKNLKEAQLAQYFDAVASGEEVRNGKPHPDIFLLAADKLGLSAGECFVLEDGYNGVRAGAAAGADVIMVVDLLEPDEEMEKTAGYICHSLREAGAYMLGQKEPFCKK